MHEIYVAKLAPHVEPAVILLGAYQDEINDIPGEIFCSFPQPNAQKLFVKWGLAPANRSGPSGLTVELMMETVSLEAQRMVDEHITQKYRETPYFAQQGVFSPGHKYLEIKQMLTGEAISWVFGKSDCSDLKDAVIEITRMPRLRVIDRITYQ